MGWSNRGSDPRPLYVLEGHEVTDRSVDALRWGRFLIGVFDEWVQHDVGTVYVQMFDVSLASWVGVPNGLCVHSETCGAALALEHNGDLYSCDHFVEPKYLLGNILKDNMIDLIASDQQRKFGLDKRDTLPNYCRVCSVRFACHGGCPKDRFIETPDGEPGLNYLCAGFKLFFNHIDRPMRIMADLIRQGRFVDEAMALLSAAGHPGQIPYDDHARSRSGPRHQTDDVQSGRFAGRAAGRSCVDGNHGARRFAVFSAVLANGASTYAQTVPAAARESAGTDRRSPVMAGVTFAPEQAVDARRFRPLTLGGSLATGSGAPSFAADGRSPRSVGRALFQTTIVNVFYEIANLVRGQVTAKITPKTWWANMKQGWVWDLDDFVVNQVGHPYQGNNYFNAGRANGLSFWESAARDRVRERDVGYFGETNHASLNDLINTTLGGIALG